MERIETYIVKQIKDSTNWLLHDKTKSHTLKTIKGMFI